MQLGELIERINSKETNVKTIATEYGVSDRTVQTRFKSKGFIYDTREKTWRYVGRQENEDVISAMKVSELLESKSKTYENRVNDATVMQQASLESNPSVSTQKRVEPPQRKAQALEMDSIDRLLSATPEKKNRMYRGFYFDTDVLEVIDSISSGNKSDLINEILRSTFKQRGRL